MEKERQTIITGIGHYLPPQVVTNFDLEKIINTSDEWIRQRTGIRERRFASPGVGSSDLGVAAARLAIEDAGLEVNEIDFIIAATLSPDHYFPGIGVLIGAKLGLPGIGALDEAVKSGRIKRGDLVVLTAFGSGFTWASAVLRW